MERALKRAREREARLRGATTGGEPGFTGGIHALGTSGSTSVLANGGVMMDDGYYEDEESN